LHRKSYTARRVQAGLTRLLSVSSYSARASVVGEKSMAEESVAVACLALEEIAGAGCSYSVLVAG